jgi:hypothetical protein
MVLVLGSLEEGRRPKAELHLRVDVGSGEENVLVGKDCHPAEVLVDVGVDLLGRGSTHTIFIINLNYPN